MKRTLLGLSLCGAIAFLGCGPRKPKVAQAEPPAVSVSTPVRDMVIDYVDFTGRTDAVEAVDIRPRVTGYLTKTPPKDGAEVKKGQLLFEVDSRPYKAQYEQAEAQVALTKASLDLATKTYSRDRSVNATVTGGVSGVQLDQDRASVAEAAARVKAYAASLETYKLNLEYCRITSPIDGRISRSYLSTGNLVNQNQTLLTTVVSLDPMYAYFDMDEPTLLKIRRAMAAGTIRRPSAGTIPVYLGLQGEEGFPTEGRIDFVNNQVNPTTGSISFRGVFANPQRGQGVRLLSPGMFVRIRLPIGQEQPALLVIDRAFTIDQDGKKSLYVVGKDNKVQVRRVQAGPLQDNGLRVVTGGLKPDERVVVSGTQQIKPNQVIRPDLVDMPRSTPAESDKPLPKLRGWDVRGQAKDKAPAAPKK